MVVNAVVSSGLPNDPDRMRETYMDNCYRSPSLFVLLREKYQILARGTICSNRKGLAKKVMCMTKSAPQNSSVVKYDQTNTQLIG